MVDVVLVPHHERAVGSEPGRDAHEPRSPGSSTRTAVPSVTQTAATRFARPEASGSPCAARQVCVTSSSASTRAMTRPSRSRCSPPASASEDALGTGSSSGRWDDVDPEPDDHHRAVRQRDELGEDAADLAPGAPLLEVVVGGHHEVVGPLQPHRDTRPCPQRRDGAQAGQERQPAELRRADRGPDAANVQVSAAPAGVSQVRPLRPRPPTWCSATSRLRSRPRGRVRPKRLDDVRVRRPGARHDLEPWRAARRVRAAAPAGRRRAAGRLGPVAVLAHGSILVRLWEPDDTSGTTPSRVHTDLGCIDN